MHRSPVACFSGRSVPEKFSSPATSTPYFRIARDGLVELDAEVSDGRLGQIKIGEAAKVMLPTGQTFEGKVRFISPRVEQATGLGKVRIALPYDEVAATRQFRGSDAKGRQRSDAQRHCKRGTL